MTRLARIVALAAGLATVAAAGLAIAQGTATQPQPAPAGQPGMMGQMPGMQHMQHMQHMHQRMRPDAQAPGTNDPHRHGAAAHGTAAPGMAAPGSAAPGSAAPGSAAPGSAAISPATAAFMVANETMHRDMAIAYSGDADRDFAAAMIPHHQGAIAMAQIQLAHGRSPEMRRLAEAVIREQEREIIELRAFLARPR